MTAVYGDTLPSATDPDAGAGVLRALPAFGAAALLSLVWDDGTRHEVRSPTVLGRNPDATVMGEGWRAVAVRDETLSLSRTHAAIGGERGAVWIADAGSRNGTGIVRDGQRHEVAPGERWIVRAGDILEFGDRRASIEGV